MRKPQITRLFQCLAFVSFVIMSCVNSVQAQTPTNRSGQPAPRTAYETFSNTPVNPVKNSELKCGGFIEYAPRDYTLEVVGGEDEPEKRV